jgi:hypothetical protein
MCFRKIFSFAYENGRWDSASFRQELNISASLPAAQKVYAACPSRREKSL